MPKAIKTHNSNTWTEAQYWSFIRSMLRKGTFRWKARNLAKAKARRPNQSANKRLKHEFQCAQCGEWFPEKLIAIDHKIPCGALKSHDDVAGFIERLYVDNPDSYQLLCKGKGSCHQEKCNEEREARKANKPLIK